MNKLSPERQKMIELLKKLFGPLKESTRIEFEKINFKSKDIAERLGADTSYVSRMLNPPINNPNSEDSYQRFNKRLSILIDLDQKGGRIQELENQLKEQSSNNGTLSRSLGKTLPFLAVLFILAIGITYWITKKIVKTEKASEEVEVEVLPVHDPMLNKSESRELFDIYGGYIQYRLAVETLEFHEMFKTGKYDNQLNYQIQELANRVNKIFEEGRRTMRGTNIRYQDGVLFSDIYEKYSRLNNVEKNINELLPLLTNKEAQSVDIIHAVTERAERQQMRNEQEWENSIITSNRNCCFILSTEEQIDRFLVMMADLNGYEMLYQGLVLKEVINNLSNNNQENRYNIARERMVDITVETIEKNRNRIRNMGYLTVTGRNIIDIIDELQPMEKNIKAAEGVVPFIADSTVTLTEIREIFLSKVAEVQSNDLNRVRQNIVNQ